MRISVVIPTRNRVAEIRRVIECLKHQSRRADEVIIVDSSDDKNLLSNLVQEFDFLRIKIESSIPSVCIQRNIGIKIASGDFIFLCDDDMEFGEDYVEKLETYLVENVDCVAVSGQWLQQENDIWVRQYPLEKFSQLLWRFIFQLSIWGDIGDVKCPALLNSFYSLIKKFYRKKGNTLTLAGWPLMTAIRDEVFQSSIYSLGASLIRRKYLLDSPYDEVLDPSGIGDNYGVAIGFPGMCPIHVIRNLDVYHHRSEMNRLEKPLSYFRRVLALHYFIKRSDRFSVRTLLWFSWSLIGNWLYFLLTGNTPMRGATSKSFRLILTGQNPYWLGYKRKEKIVIPNYE